MRKRKNEKIAKCELQWKALKKLYKEFISKKCTKKVPKEFDEKEVNILVRERDEIMDRLEEIEDDTEDHDTLHTRTWRTRRARSLAHRHHEAQVRQEVIMRFLFFASCFGGFFFITKTVSGSCWALEG